MCRSLNISRQFTELVIHGGERMIEKIIWIAGIFVLSGAFWYCIFYQKEKKLLNRLQQMLDDAIDGELERTEISEETDCWHYSISMASALKIEWTILRHWNQSRWKSTKTH